MPVQVALMLNEFGEFCLDYDVLVETAVKTVPMVTGCLCREVRGNLVPVHEAL